MMNRRQYLSVMGVGFVAGCSSSPEPEPPEILIVNLISDFEDFGDVEENAIQSAAQGETIFIGYRHETWVHDGEISITTEVRIFDAQDNRVAIRRNQGEQLVEGNGPQEWENALAFDATWGPGDYVAEVIIRDDVTEEISEPQTGSFQITEPEVKLEVTSSEVYRESYSSGVRGVAENVSDDELSYAEVIVEFFDDEGRRLDRSTDSTSDLAPGREWTFDALYSGDVEFQDHEIRTDWST